MNDIALITGASTPLKLADGKTVQVKPLTFETFGELYNEMILERMRYAPKVEEAVSSIPANSSRDFVANVVSAVAYARKSLLEPTFEELMDWLASNPVNIARAVWYCIDDKDKYRNWCCQCFRYVRSRWK